MSRERDGEDMSSYEALGSEVDELAESDADEQAPVQLEESDDEFLHSPNDRTSIKVLEKPERERSDKDSKRKSKKDAVKHPRPRSTAQQKDLHSMKAKYAPKSTKKIKSGSKKADSEKGKNVLSRCTGIVTSVAGYVWDASRKSVKTAIFGSVLQLVIAYLLAVTLLCMLPPVAWLPQYAGICPTQGFGILGKSRHSPFGCNVWPFSYYLEKIPHCNLQVAQKYSQPSGLCAYYPPGLFGICAPQRVLEKKVTEKAVAVMFDDVGSIAQYANYGSTFVNRYSHGARSIFILSRRVQMSTLEDRDKISKALGVVYYQIRPLSENMMRFEAKVNTMAHMVRLCITRLNKLIENGEKESGGLLTERQEKKIAKRFFRETNSLAKDIENLEDTSTFLQGEMDYFTSALDSVYAAAAQDSEANKAALAVRQGPLAKLFDTFSAEEYKTTLGYKRHFEILESISDHYKDGWAEADRSFKMITQARTTLEELSKSFSEDAYDFDAESIHYLIVRVKEKINVLNAAMAMHRESEVNRIEEGERDS